MQIEDGWRELGVHDRLQEFLNFREPLKPGLHKIFRLGEGLQLKSGFNKDAERVAAADKQPAQIVTGNIFHNTSARLDRSAIPEHHADSQQVITRRAVTEAARAAPVVANQLSNGSAFREWRIQGQPLPLLEQLLLERCNRHARFYRASHVRSTELGQSIEPGQIDPLHFLTRFVGLLQAAGEVIAIGWGKDHGAS